MSINHVETKEELQKLEKFKKDAGEGICVCTKTLKLILPDFVTCLKIRVICWLQMCIAHSRHFFAIQLFETNFE